MSMSPFLIVDQTCYNALQWAKQQISNAGMQAVQTFDLQDARAGSHDCSCPHHGTEQCDCQLVVLLVYGSGNRPETLILHGSGGKTWLSIGNSGQPRTSLVNQIQQALDS